jgi:hypothetical protein
MDLIINNYAFYMNTFLRGHHPLLAHNILQRRKSGCEKQNFEKM